MSHMKSYLAFQGQYPAIAGSSMEYVRPVVEPPAENDFADLLFQPLYQLDCPCMDQMFVFFDCCLSESPHPRAASPMMLPWIPDSYHGYFFFR